MIRKLAAVAAVLAMTVGFAAATTESASAIRFKKHPVVSVQAPAPVTNLRW